MTDAGRAKTSLADSYFFSVFGELLDRLGVDLAVGVAELSWLLVEVRLRRATWS